MKDLAESAISLGSRKSLVGILTSNPELPPQPDRPVLVILNSGIIHRVGPNRMSVTLARALAAKGFVVLRFDNSGIGDSEPRLDALPPFEAGLADIREAIDSLQASRGPVKFVLVGLCSGADQSAFVAADDARVVGIVLLDPSIPRTRRYSLNHYASRLMRGESWLNFATGRHLFWSGVRQRLDGAAAPASDADGYASVDHPEVKAALARIYQKLAARSIETLMVCTGEGDSQTNYREQFLDAFPDVQFGRCLQLEFHEKADHTFTGEAERNRLIDTVVDWTAARDFGK